MNDKQLKRQIIHLLAEEGVPDHNNPWEAVEKRLKRGRHSSGRNNPTNLRLNLRIVGLLALVFVLMVSGLFFVTPQGRAVAQNLLHLFVKADQDTLSLPTGQPNELINPTKTAVPTQIVGLQTVTPQKAGAGDLFTPTPKEKTEYGDFMDGLAIDEAERLAIFNIRTPQSIPSGYRLANVIFNKQTREVRQVYQYSPYQSGEMFFLSQQPSQPLEPIGQSAKVEQIQVGDIMIEMVTGSWFAPLGANQEKWNNDAYIRTYRWQQNGFYFTLQFWVNETFSPAYLSETDMQEMVEILIGARSTRLEKVNLNNLTSIEEAEKAAGFKLLAPTVLPEGFVFRRAVYEPDEKRAVFIFGTKDTSRSSNGPALIFYEIAKKNSLEIVKKDDFPPEAIEQVMIGAIPGIYQRGSIIDGKYDPEAGITLHWHTGELEVTAAFFSPTHQAARLGKTDMITIAEGLH